MKTLKTIPNLGLGYGWGKEADSEVGVGSLGSIASSKSYMPCPNSGLDLLFFFLFFIVLHFFQVYSKVIPKDG